MRRMTLDMVPDKDLYKLPRTGSWNISAVIERTTILDTLYNGLEKGVNVVLLSMRLRKERSIEDIKFPDEAQVLAVLKSDGRDCTVLMKTRAPSELLWLERRFNLNLIWDIPSRRTRDRLEIGVLGSEDDLRKLLDAAKLAGEVKSVKYNSTQLQEHRLLSCLTNRQKEVVVAAKRNGYYDYPRRIDSSELARRLGLSKSTVVEHLRKAEKRLVSHLFDDG